MSSTWGTCVTSISIYLFAGDFAEVLRRYERGDQQVYQTHNEVARLIHDLLGMQQRLNIYSFVTPERGVERPMDRLRIINLGAKDYSASSLQNWRSLRMMRRLLSRIFLI